MNNFVSLSTDHAPLYCVYAPIAARAWASLGYRAIVHIDAEGWAAPLNQLVLAEMEEADAIVHTIGAVPPLSTPNVMRASRLVAPCYADLPADAFMLTANVDIIPLQRAHFTDLPPFIALRCCYNAHLDGGMPSDDRSVIIRAGAWRLPMCYAGATIARWRSLFPELVTNDATASLAALAHDLTQDSSDLDERVLSFRFLSASPEPTQHVHRGEWRKGDLVLRDPLDAQRYHPDLAPGMGCIRRWADAIDFLPELGRLNDLESLARPLRRYFPEHATWFDSYAARVSELRSVTRAGAA